MVGAVSGPRPGTTAEVTVASARLAEPGQGLRAKPDEDAAAVCRVYPDAPWSRQGNQQSHAQAATAARLKVEVCRETHSFVRDRQHCAGLRVGPWAEFDQHPAG